MGGIKGLFRRANAPDAEQRGTRQSVGSTPAWLTAWFEGSNLSTAGQDVTEDTALALTAVYNAITLISRSIGAMPLTVYKRLSDGGRKAQPAHPVNYILHTRPKAWYSPMQWEETGLAHTLTGGNGYSLIERRGAGGMPEHLRLLAPANVRPAFNAGGELTYEYREQPGQTPTIIYADTDIVHWRGLGSDGIMGWSPIKVCANSLGVSIAAQEFGAGFYANGARPSGALSYPGVMQAPARENVKKSIAELYSGTGNVGRPMLLEEGLTWTPMSIPPEEAQWLQSRQFGIAEVARIYNIQPHKLKDLSKSSFNNIEAQNIDFVVDTLTPWLVMIEEELNYKMFTTREQADGYFVKHNVGALLRGDLATRSAWYSTALQNGILSRNEVRAFEELNTIPDGGDTYTVQMNLTPIEKLGEEPEPAPAPPLSPPGGGESTDPEDDARSDRITLAHVPVLADAIGKALRRQAKAVTHAAKAPEKFDKWLEKWVDDEEARLRRDIGPSLDAWAMATGKDDAESVALQMAIRVAARSLGDVHSCLCEITERYKPEDIPQAVAAICSTWNDELATERAQDILTNRRQ